ncbi:transcriptional regulator, AraC family [Agrococcus baldri]|uniref:Transcriptional regulator, AraC family n=1 Tax=Agrococcus baldri TaxID=153730 RepID=A0AA94HP61_9MICO|nr:helix-turn-helix domain-containing protein [Agrococcus baldri]SFS14894.1 transcriptional regulator, AraC family [Agrococcus baldri]
MTDIFDFPPLEAPFVDLAQWRRDTTENFVPLDVHPLGESPFRARASRVDVGEVSVFRIEHTASIVARTPALVSRGATDLIKVSLQLSGEELIEQDGRVALLHPGDLAIYDTSRPYTLRFDGTTSLVVITFPHGYLDIPREELASVTATAFPLESPLGRVVNPFLVGLAQSLAQLPAEHGQRLARSGLDLLMTLIHTQLKEGVRRDPRRQLLHELLGTIDELLGDPELSPAQVADAHFISTRHLHAVFAERGITVAGWIRERRLERIRRDLTDAQLADLPIARIASRWGLVNPAHFSRLFRATFGHSPTEYRVAASVHEQATSVYEQATGVHEQATASALH